MMAYGNNGSARRRPGGPRFRVAALPFLLSRVKYWSAHKFTGAINAKGAVRWFNPTEGYGYTQPQGGGKDVFVHIWSSSRRVWRHSMTGKLSNTKKYRTEGRTSAGCLKIYRRAAHYLFSFGAAGQVLEKGPNVNEPCRVRTG
jgi:cold shock protein